MIIEENLDTYFLDLGQDVYFKGKKKKGLLNMPDEILAGDLMISTDYVLQVKTKDFTDLDIGETIRTNLNGILTEFEVKGQRLLDDGKLTEIELSKTWVQKGN